MLTFINYILALSRTFLPNPPCLEYRLWREEEYDGATPRRLHRGGDQFQAVRLHGVGSAGLAHRVIYTAAIQVNIMIKLRFDYLYFLEL